MAFIKNTPEAGIATDSGAGDWGVLFRNPHIANHKLHVRRFETEDARNGFMARNAIEVIDTKDAA